MAYATDLDQSVYVQNGYGEELVDALTSVLPPSEDFDGLLTELEDNYGYFD
jgi:hypothetical protein